MTPAYFATPDDWRAWLEANHASRTELLVGFYKRGSGRPGITWQESVDAALCFGWIDGVRRRIDDERYTIRFTPRKASSIWSSVNIKRVAELTKLGQMQPAGLRAFAARQEKRSGVYSFEQEIVAFTGPQERQFQSDKKAWNFFNAQAPSYCRAATWWVVNAKREETRVKRLAMLMDESRAGHRLAQFTAKKFS